MRTAMTACVLASAVTCCLTAGEAAARRRGDGHVLLQARSTAGLEALEAGRIGSHPSQAVRRPVSDLIVRLKPWDEGSIAAAFDPLPFGRPAREASRFAAELIIVAAGRIQIEERAACGPWVGDTAICRTECDGGAFALVRRGAGAAGGFALKIGKVGAIADAGFGEIARLGACSDEIVAGGLAARVGADAVEIQLDRR